MTKTCSRCEMPMPYWSKAPAGMTEHCGRSERRSPADVMDGMRLALTDSNSAHDK